MARDYKAKLGLKSHPAQFWRKLSEDVNNQTVECYLCPRHCKIRPEQAGFCQVRKNENGQLQTLNYGVSVQMTQEYIETEACNHFNPGAAILSLGNIGCMMACDFCHNWQTSQMKYVEKKEVHFYTPEQVVETALEKGIGVLSWTYNDPVVWQEFVVDTARLARRHGLRNLYKSAFYISPEAIDELLGVMDVFSLSLKSMDPVFYSQITKGRLQPVLDGIKRVYDHGQSHLELSNLIVTGRNDKMSEVDRLVEWMLTHLDENVPLHIVRFHPDFRYTHVGRTSIPFLIAARERARELGLRHVYLGNVYEENEGLLTRCLSCQAVLVSRYGLAVDSSGLDERGYCRNCHAPSAIKRVALRERAPSESPPSLPGPGQEFRWRGDINACHITLVNPTAEFQSYVTETFAGQAPSTYKSARLAPGEKWRMIASRSSVQELGVRVHASRPVLVQFFEVFDRAHFPTQDGGTLRERAPAPMAAR